MDYDRAGMQIHMVRREPETHDSQVFLYGNGVAEIVGKSWVRTLLIIDHVLISTAVFIGGRGQHMSDLLPDQISAGLKVSKDPLYSRGMNNDPRHFWLPLYLGH